MTGADMVALFERCGVRRTEITAQMMNAVDLATKAEREECAKIADAYGKREPVAREIADVIRERSEQ